LILAFHREKGLQLTCCPLIIKIGVCISNWREPNK
jgi:hypothetical protein